MIKMAYLLAMAVQQLTSVNQELSGLPGWGWAMRGVLDIENLVGTIKSENEMASQWPVAIIMARDGQGRVTLYRRCA